MSIIGERKAFAIWFTGLSGAGKTTLCNTVAIGLEAQGFAVQILDGDLIRKDICSDLGFTTEDRMQNVLRITYISNLIIRHGVIVLVAAISPLRAMREVARSKLGSMLEVFVNAPLEVCEARDTKGLYKRARAGDIKNFTGIDGDYEPPLTPDVMCRTDLESISASTEKVLSSALDLLYKSNMPQDSAGCYDRAEPERRSIAVDFDGVIADYDGWRGREIIGPPRDDVLSALHTLRAEGWKIIVHTTRCQHDVLSYLRRSNIPFDEINRNSDKPTLGAKPHANVYWDDRALPYSGDALKDMELIRAFRTWTGRA